MAASPTGLKRAWVEPVPVTPTKRPRLDTLSTTRASQGNGLSEVQPVILADCPEHQYLWDRLPVGTLYEVARIAAEKHIKMEQIPRKQLNKLYGTNVQSIEKIVDALGCGPVRVLEKQAAEALDFEASSIVAEDGRMLEHEMGSRHISGRVHFTAELSMRELIRDSSISMKPPSKSPSTPHSNASEPKPDKPIISLRMPRFGVSCLFSRVFGSHRFLRVKILERGNSRYSSDACLGELAAWSLRPIYIFGRKYRALVEKEGTIWYYLQGNDLVGKSAQDLGKKKPGEYGLGRKISDNFCFIQWWIPLEMNRDQLFCKLGTRLHLGISGTQPGPLIPQAKLCEDIVREVDGKKVVFTDGSGVISKGLGNKIWVKCAASKAEPAAYQIRLGTSKGVVQVAPEANGVVLEREWIEITESMLKARQGGEWDKGPIDGMSILAAAHNVVCVVKPATCRYPARLSFQLIPILCEQGVPLSAIEDLQRKTVSATIQNLRIPTPNEMQDNQMVMAFAKTIQRYANLVYITKMENRIYQDNAPREKYTRNQERKWRVDELVPTLENEDGNLCHADVVLDRNMQLYLAVTCGLNIRGTSYFMGIWKKLLKKAVFSATMSFKIEVPGSVYCTIVPDFTGRLEEGEISFAPQLEMQLHDMDFTAGEVLVGRHPAYLPTDVRKVRLANIPELRKRKGIIYFSTKGRRPLADRLAGGDYDGDDVILIWEPSLVTEFHNADDHLSEKPDSVGASFERELITAGAVQDILAEASHEDRLRILSEHLLASLKVSNLYGFYNSYFLRAVHIHGISSEQARILGHKFNTLIDAARTSFRLKPEARIQDARDWGKYADPLWKRKKDEYERWKEDSSVGQFLPKTDKINVLDELYKMGAEYHEAAWLEDIGVGGSECIFDRVQKDKLASWWVKAEAKVAENPAMARELELILAKVKEAQGRFNSIGSRYGGKGFAHTEEKNAAILELAHWFANNPPVKDVPLVTGVVGQAALEAVRASYAFILDSRTSNGGVGFGTTSGFCWIMAIVPLLKAMSSQPITLPFPAFAMLTPHSSFCNGQEVNEQ